MDDVNDPSPRAHVKLPGWLAGHDVLGYANQAKLKFHGVDASQLAWDVETLERYERRSPRLVEVVDVAGPEGRASWEMIANLPGLDSSADPAAVLRERIASSPAAQSSRSPDWPSC